MGITGAAHACDYCASKFAVAGYCESLRQELLNTNVHVSCIFPGLVNTEMFKGVSHHMPLLTPPLDAVTVADRIVDVFRSNRSQDVFMPFYGRILPLIKMLPVELNDLIHVFTGANEYLKNFKN